MLANNIKKINNLSLFEDYMSYTEVRLKKDLTKLLQSEGYIRYAKRLAPLDVKILYPSDELYEEIETAAISFDEMCIYINTGFLDMPYYKRKGTFIGSEHFEQMSVIIRHELCHNLLMHQIRMVSKLQKIFPEKKLRFSSSLAELLNILEDFEISNLRYSEADKEIVRNTYLNGKIISGLVTEDHRDSWKTLSLEKMYDELLKEIDEIYSDVKVRNAMHPTSDSPFGALAKDAQKDWAGNVLPNYNKPLTRVSVKAHKYKNKKDFSDVYDIDELFRQIAYIKSINQNIGNDFEEIAIALKETIVDDPINEYKLVDIEKMISQIKDSKINEVVELKSPVTNQQIIELNIPEEKEFAIEALNVIAGKTPYNYDFKVWKNQIEKHIKPGEFSDDELKELIDILEKNKKTTKVANNEN